MDSTALLDYYQLIKIEAFWFYIGYDVSFLKKPKNCEVNVLKEIFLFVVKYLREKILTRVYPKS